MLTTFLLVLLAPRASNAHGLTLLTSNRDASFVRFEPNDSVGVLSTGSWEVFRPGKLDPVIHVSIPSDIAPLGISDSLVFELGDCYDCVSILRRPKMLKLGKTLEIPGLGDPCDADLNGKYFALSSGSTLLEYRTTNLSTPAYHVNLDRFTRQHGLNARGIFIDAIQYDPAGRSLAVARGSKVFLLRRQGLDLLRVFRGQKGLIDSLAFSRDGKLLVAGSDDGACVLWSTGVENLFEEFD